MKIAFSAIDLKKPVLAVGIDESLKLADAAAQIDKAGKGIIAKVLKANPAFTGKVGQFLTVHQPAELPQAALLLVGLGQKAKLDNLAAMKIGGKLVAQANSLRVKEIAAVMPEAVLAAHAAYGAKLRSYRFDKYRTKEKAEDKPTLASITFLTKDPAAAKKAFAPLDSTAESIFLTRNLVSEPANVIYPASFVARAKELAKLGVKIKVLGEKEMTKLGMGALLGVGQGSRRESQLLILEWNGAAKTSQPVAFVGKGVTFDTGGISIKPAGGMEEMKWDMAGAATVTGLIRTLAARKAKVNVIGVAGLVENMPDGNAQRPGDVVTSMSGQTIEVVNTDAEGRLVLSDALHYVNTVYKPKFIVDLATLTGAIIIALGSSRAGLFSNDDKLAEQISDAAKDTDEPVWRLPLGDEYDKQINCDVADMQNVGYGREAGSITAAQFLQRFVGKTPWAHLDIAGVAWSKKDADFTPKGATAFGVRLLDRMVAKHYEGK
ncbi:MAG: leucyl aminopeptidase [Alphaproteobacteria bacterium]|nr:leucyl aminopeptidase [Alphaproteobacteria bacterium]